MDEFKQKAIDWKLWWMVGAFLLGSLFTAGIGWGRNQGSLETISLQIAELKGSMSTLADTYNRNDKTVGIELQKIESHLDYQDMRLNKLELNEKH